MEHKIYKILELYSGIGGMHFALSESEIPFDVVAAVDINTTANQIYQHNFPKTKLINKCIESMSMKQLDSLKCNMLLMSPPCQPFCRVGKQQDMHDERTKSFLYILEILPQLDNPPDCILLENVKGFDTSESCKRLLATLDALSYEVQEFLLSPLQFGIPNSRLRYYLLAKRKPLKFVFGTTTGIITEIPKYCEQFLIHRTMHSMESEGNSPDTDPVSELNCQQEAGSTPENLPKSTETQDEKCNMIGANLHDNSVLSYDNQTRDSLDDEDIADNESELPLYQKYKSVCRCIGDYLHKDSDGVSIEDYLLPEKFFKRFWVMDIVTAASKNSCCFTKRYAHHMEGSGSIIQMSTGHEHDLSYYKRKRIYDDTVHEAVRQRKLRFFSPREIANLMCFPEEFSFPEEMSNIQCYRVLGNSLNVHVVSVLIRLLVAE